jgi:hypothetical protein
MSQREKSTKTLIMSMAAGILIVLNAVAVGIAGTWFPWIFPTLPGSENNSTVPFVAIASIGMINGILVLLGAMMFHIKTQNMKAWSIMTITFSILSVITGGGFIVGFILGIIGGTKALKSRPKMQTKKS